MKILLIGNKDIEKDISDKIANGGFDMIVRYNRMTNFEKTYTHQTDLYLCDMWVDSRSFFRGENKYKFKTVKQFIRFFHDYEKKEICKVLKLDVNEVNFTDCEFSSLPINEYILDYHWEGGKRITNALWMIIYLLEKYPNDEIYITCIDYKDRSFLNKAEWHRFIYKWEEIFIQNMIQQNKITPIFYDE